MVGMTVGTLQPTIVTLSNRNVWSVQEVVVISVNWTAKGVVVTGYEYECFEKDAVKEMA